MTGGYSTYKLRTNLTVNAGMDCRNEFTSLNGKPNCFFGFNWTNQDGKINVAYE